MDPITQGAAGASLAQTFSNKKQLLLAGLLGFLSGMAPDLDILIRSDQDPLLSLEFHRQFTHSLIFIPIGGLICAGFFHLILGRFMQAGFKQTYIYCTLGYATHGLLDTCTSYGTQLLWPFTNTRYSWDTISIIDPLLSLPLLILIILAGLLSRPRYALAGVIWVIAYQCTGFYQNQRASEIGWQLAQQRGHQPVRLVAKPTLGNIILWKVIYEVNDGFYTDGVRVGLTTKVYPGTFTAKLNVEKNFPWLDKASQQARDLQRFAWFSQGFVAVDRQQPNRVIDVRYSLLPNQSKGLWSIWLSPQAGPHDHISYRMDRNINHQNKAVFYRMLLGK